MKTLTLPKSSRIFRWYETSLKLWLTFTSNKQRRTFFENGDNLCHFVRTCVLYAPTVVLCHLLTAWWVYHCFFGIPADWFGTRDYLLSIAKGVGALLAVVGAVMALIFGGEFIQKHWQKFRGRRPEVEKESHFERIARAWVDSKLHSKICPPIDFEERS
jgi:hypothetical protein